jgi:hypothetical protein
MLSRAAARLRLRARNAGERPVDEYLIIDLRTVPDGSSNPEHVDLIPPELSVSTDCETK